ncbi:MAG TPA: hypothetical protein DCL54_01490 [Alphaproteobacteria bacterium]|nr:hypothetical protein [Alphaproteobacteria bacterium]HAJ45239.1 hypothetical protein [Alphaproteobacteria bacterium]
MRSCIACWAAHRYFEPINEQAQQPMREHAKKRRRHAASTPRTELPILYAVVFVCLGALLVWAPIPLGSDRDWFVSHLSAGAAVLTMGWGLALGTGLVRSNENLRALWPAALALSASLIMVALQITDLRLLGGEGGQGIGAMAHPIWGLTADAAGRDGRLFISVYPDAAFAALNKTFLYVAAFYLSFELAQDPARARAICWTVMGAGAFATMFGMMEVALQSSFSDWFSGENWQKYYDSRFSGTLINPNSYATFAGVTLLAGLGLTYTGISAGMVAGRGQAIFLRSTLNTLLGPMMLPLGAALLLFGGVLLTGSRAGTMSVAAATALLVVLLSFSQSGAKSGSKTVDASMLSVLALLLIGLLVGSQALTTTLGRLETADAARPIVWDGAWIAATSSPFLGNGFGAFGDYYPLYAQDVINGYANRAHNDYLEVFADLGFAGGAAFLFAPVYLAWLCAIGYVRRRRGKVIPAIGVAASILVGVHAMFDFSAQIPAVGVAFYVLMGACVAESLAGSGKRRSDSHGSGDHAPMPLDTMDAQMAFEAPPASASMPHSSATRDQITSI